MSRIFSDLRWPEKTGIGNVMSSVIKKCPPDFKIIDLKIPGKIGSPMSPLSISMRLPKESRKGDIFWSAGFFPPLYSNMPSIVTVHDLTHLRFYSAAHSMYYNYVLKNLYKKCKAIICVSGYTRNEFINWSGVPENRVHVVLNGVDGSFYENTETLNLPYRYILYPGNHRSYKNLNRLIIAYARSNLPKSGIDLVLTGCSNPDLIKTAVSESVLDHLHFAGYLSDEDLPRIYKGAEAIAFLSLYEGFGLPIIEAMASKVPVVTSNVSSMPEVAGKAALLVNPYSIEDIADSLNSIVFDSQLRQNLVSLGIRRAKEFDWEKSSKKLWGIVRDVSDKWGG